MRAKQLQIIVWSIFTTAVVLAVVAWGQGNGWKLVSLGFYQVFPLFGLLAFSMMWSHYMAAALRTYFKLEPGVLKQYFETTSMAVLGAILLHPGLLWWQLWRDGLGLPPTSSYKYVSPSMKLYIVIALISLTLFLAFELRRKYGKKPWWKFVAYGSDLSMLLIVIHALKLGSQLQVGWFRTVWYFYALSLVCALIYMYLQTYAKFKKTR